MKNDNNTTKRLLLYRLTAYFRTMADLISEYASGIVKNTSTPTKFFIALIFVVGLLIKYADLPDTPNLILVCLLPAVFIAYVLFLVCDPKRLVFRAEEHLIWHREQLGDNKLKGLYIHGQKPPEQLKSITEEDDPNNL